MQELPKGLRLTARGSVVDDTGLVWQEGTANPLRGGEIRKAIALATANGVAYATPKTGRMGWNVRASYPSDYIRRRLPFVVVRNGDQVTVTTYRATNMTIPSEAR